MNNISLIISIVALAISGATFWLTRIKKGNVKMTRPTIIFFGPDGGGEQRNKIFIRTLLYSTSERGQYIQNMFISLQRGESVQNFNVWAYGEREQLVRGSGLFISKNGLALNHHFLQPKDGADYQFLSGDYLLSVFIETVDETRTKIFEQLLSVTKDQQNEMAIKKAGLFFDWAPNTQNYFSHIDIRPLTDDELLKKML
jgi:hypothetical protein